MTTLADRIASKFWFQDRYAKLILSMSLSEARKVLDISPGAGIDEIQKSFKTKALKAHPDRGGSHEKMVELNVARDLLLGEGTSAPKGPARGPGPSSPSGTRWDEEEYQRRKRETIKKGKDFANAVSQAPSGVTWKFRSNYMLGKSSDFTQEQSKFEGKGLNSHNIIWVCYGQTSSQHVFLLVEHAVPNTQAEFQWDEWCFEVSETYPLTQDIEKLAPKAIKSVLGKGKLTNGVSKATTKYTELSRLSLGELERREGGVNLKDILIGTGLTSGAKADRKTVVELKGTRSRFKDERNRKGPPSEKVTYNIDTWKLCDFVLYINGKGYPLSDETVANLGKHGTRGSLFWMMLYGAVEYDFERKRVLTKVQGAQSILEMVEASLRNEPSDLTVQLLKAIEELDSADNSKKAAESVAARFLKSIGV